MNQKNLNDIFEHYIEKFEEINNPDHFEVYKWIIAQKFRPMMDEALVSSDDEFSDKLLKVRNLTENIIDSYLQPFYGLVKCAKEEPDAVRQLFLDLFQDDGGDLVNREERIRNFLKGSHDLRDKHFEGSFLYTDDFHSATSYLSLYDPNHNYFLKQTQSRRFAECVEYYDDWGTGENVNLAKYYKMCDELVEAIKQNETLMKTDASRFDPRLGFGELYPDLEKHILAFDIIYCSTVYDLYSGISIIKRNAKERVLYEERKKKAKERKEALDAAYLKKDMYDALCASLEKAFSTGSQLTHTKMGKGSILEVKNGSLSVQFEGKEIPTKLSLPLSIANELIVPENDSFFFDDEQKALLLEGNQIQNRLQGAEKQFAPYADDLE